MGKRKVTWTKTATRQFNEVIDYIRQDSDKNAEKIKDKILAKINQLSENKITHRKDPIR